MQRALLTIVVLTIPLFAGCVDPTDDMLEEAGTLAPGVVRVIGPDGGPAVFAPIVAYGPASTVLAVMSTDAEGRFDARVIPQGTVRVVIAPVGARSWSGDVHGLPAEITLTAAPSGTRLDVPSLQFLEPLLMGRAYLGDQAASCAVSNCGASEPTVEVAGDGTIYVSGVCCIGKSPPIWVSRDGGATFTVLKGDPLRDNFGIEGDFAVDDAGNMYFTDISAASAYIASWDKTGKHRWTVPAGPFVPLVDRPWVRAGAENEVYFLYNTGASTAFYKSTDGGLTWLPKHMFSANLGTLGQGPERDHLWVVAGGMLYASTDGGEAWSAGERIPRPEANDARAATTFRVPVVDEGGNVWVVSDWSTTVEDVTRTGIYAARRDPAGAWHGPYEVSPPNGTHVFPWPAAGRAGTLVVAWYGVVDGAKTMNALPDDAEWHVYAAATVNGLDETPTFQVTRADPESVLNGPMGRRLLDFLQVDIGPDGAVHLVYAQSRDGRTDEATMYVKAPDLLGFAPAVYPNGPGTA